MTPMTLLRRLWISSMLLLPVGLAVSACDDAEQAFDCAAICNDFQRCFNSELDTVQCTERCADKSDVDDDVRADADVCAECIDGKACAEATRDCSTCDRIFILFGTD